MYSTPYTSLESGNHYFLTVFLSTACSRPSLCSTSLTCCSEIDQLCNVKSPWALTWCVAPCKDPLSLAAHEHFLCNSWWCWFASADGRSSKLRKKERERETCNYVASLPDFRLILQSESLGMRLHVHWMCSSIGRRDFCLLPRRLSGVLTIPNTHCMVLTAK